MATTKLSRRAFGFGLAGCAVGSWSAAHSARLTPEQRAARLSMGGDGPLAYRPIYKLYEYSKVEQGARTWVLPRRAQPVALDFDYEVDGQLLHAAQFAERTATLGLLILKRGEIVTELYRAGTTAASPLTSASMSKSVCSILMGIAIADKAVQSLDQQVTDYIAELRKTGYDGVTIRQLINMRSGVKWNDDFFVPGPAQQIQADSLVDNIRRYTDAALETVRDHRPGEHFSYNSLDAAVAGWVIERATRQPLTQYTSEKLWKPAGMEAPAYWLLDGAPGVGRAFVAGGFNAVLRDYGRLGQLMLNGGVADRRQIVPTSWVKESVTSLPGPAQPGGLYRYGYYWWLLDGSDAYTALGGYGQYIYVNPSHQTVIIKMSWASGSPKRRANALPEVIPWDNETQSFFRAAAKWNSR
jgi:CubicO group peptidase (beta-lactamase class C family)